MTLGPRSTVSHRSANGWPVSLVIADGYYNLPQVFRFECTGKHTHLITPKGNGLHVKNNQFMIKKTVNRCTSTQVFFTFSSAKQYTHKKHNQQTLTPTP